MNTRGSGVLLHITSLPSRFGIGDLGPAAYEFVRFLADAGQRYWQILPIHPTDAEYDNSPYHALSAFASNTLLISPKLMVTDEFLDASDLESVPAFSPETVHYEAVTAWKERIFSLAFERFVRRGKSPEFTDFCRKNKEWLDDYAIFMALRRRMAPALRDTWPDELRRYTPHAISHARMAEADQILKEQFLQYLFSIQWSALRRVCRESGIILIGDIPIYVDYDSADVWTHPTLFKLDRDLNPVRIAGVPPDYFSETGQVWGSPVYEWEEMKRTRYSWWISRIEQLITRVDYLRIDHFRGLIGFWEIPAGSETAVTGRWEKAPAEDFLKTLTKKFPYLPIIAEDLGIITPDVREVMREFSIPGMKVLLFAFGHGMPASPYIPHHIPKECIVYTGTHDNNPIQGWFASDATDVEKKNLSDYLGRTLRAEEINDELIRMAMMSVAHTVIIPMQDLLNLGEESRMNRPGVDTGNWQWRVTEFQLSSDLAGKMNHLARVYDRI